MKRIHSSIATHGRSRGFSIIELMIGMALGLLVLTAVTAVFVNSSRTRAELEKTSQQIENGRYATQLLIDDLRLAGYYGELNPTTSVAPTPSTKPDACATGAASLTAAIALPIQGYDGGASLPSTCATVLTDRKVGTDVLVIRRASTCFAGSSGCEAADLTKYTYFQVNRCSTGLTPYVIDNASASFTLTKADCTTVADKRSYFTRIYYIANNNKSGDGIPTLKMAELVSGAFSVIPLVAGIEQLQLEYGIDTDANGTPDAYTADPDTYNSCTGAACQTNWRHVTAVKIHILARNTESTPNYTDTRSYVLGKKADGSDYTIAADNASYKRHVYTTVARLMNVAGRLE